LLNYSNNITVIYKVIKVIINNNNNNNNNMCLSVQINNMFMRKIDKYLFFISIFAHIKKLIKELYTYTLYF